MDKYWHIVTICRLVACSVIVVFVLVVHSWGFTSCLVQFCGFGQFIVPCIPYYGIMQNSFTALEIPFTLSLLPSAQTPGSHWFFYCLYNLPLYNMGYVFKFSQICTKVLVYKLPIFSNILVQNPCKLFIHSYPLVEVQTMEKEIAFLEVSNAHVLCSHYTQNLHL